MTRGWSKRSCACIILLSRLNCCLHFASQIGDLLLVLGERRLEEVDGIDHFRVPDIWSIGLLVLLGLLLPCHYSRSLAARQKGVRGLQILPALDS